MTAVSRILLIIVTVRERKTRLLQTPRMLLWAVCSVVSLCNPMDYNPPGFSVHGIPGKNPSAACYFLLLGIFPTQGSNPCLLHLLHWQTDSAPPWEAQECFCSIGLSCSKSTVTRSPKTSFLMPWHENIFILQSPLLEFSSSDCIFPSDSH